MHTGRRVIEVALVAGLAVVTLGTPVGADPWDPPSSGGGGGNGGFNAWAYWASATGGGGTPTRESCEMPRDYWPDPQTPPPSHIEYVAYEIPAGSGHYSVWKDCVVDGYTVNPDLPNGLTWFPLDNWQVEAGDPEELIREALAYLNPDPPQIGTSPDAATAAFVGIPTWYWLEGGLPPINETITDGPLAVTVTATPTGVTWDPGNGGSVVCRDELGVGSPGTDTCSFTYERSSVEQAGSDPQGRSAYTVSADIEYVGSYSVTLGGVAVGGQTNIGGVGRVSETLLAVNEAQAINTRDGG
jgi:hypothetical protein